jgi:Rrf2 family protein
VHITAKADYALRAALELAAAEGRPAKGDDIASAQEIPAQFLTQILLDMRHAGLVRSQRGREGGYWLDRPADRISLGEVIRAVEGPLASVHGDAPEALAYPGPSKALQTVWIALRANLRAVLDEVTLADVVADELPRRVVRLTERPEAWIRR